MGEKSGWVCLRSDDWDHRGASRDLTGAVGITINCRIFVHQADTAKVGTRFLETAFCLHIQKKYVYVHVLFFI